MKKIFYPFIILLFLQSCKNPANSEHPFGTGEISFELNNIPKILSNVSAYEYIGFYCGGEIDSIKFALGLGTHANEGDTIKIPSGQNGFLPIYARYDGKYASSDSGMIIISSHVGTNIKGNFRFNIYTGTDTLHFENGYFNAAFLQRP